jgi:hypothetical protein
MVGKNNIPPMINSSLVGGHAAVHIYQFFVLPWPLLPLDYRGMNLGAAGIPGSFSG